LVRPVRSGIVTFNGKDLYAEPIIPTAVSSILDLLSSGH
jgi:hypothetical protein